MTEETPKNNIQAKPKKTLTEDLHRQDRITHLFIII